ncbi:MAG: GNAT family protein [Anaerolineales bacterium]
MVFTPLETPRLVLRRFQDRDLPAFVEYRNDPEVARYQSWDSISAPRAQTFIQEQKKVEPGIPGQWFQFAAELKASGALAGDLGLCVTVLDARQAQLGVTFAREHQHHGLATEAMTAVLDFAFINLDLHRVIAIVDAENSASARLMGRVGLRREGHFLKNTWFKEHWSDEFLFAVLQAEWLPRRAAQAAAGAKAGAGV